jgi:DedD protein
MEKEQKKLLLVAVSVGVFLLVTITVAIMMLTPKAQLAEAGFTSSTVIPSGGLLPVDVQPLPPIQEPVAQTPDTFGTSVAVDSNDGDSLTIQIPAPSTAAVPDNADIPETPKAVVSVAPTRVRQTAPAEQPAATPAKPAATRPASTATPSSAAARPSAKTVNDYWIQTGAFKALVRAEDAKETLSTKGLTSLIDTRVVNGETYYRVRLGPYTSEREANNWLTLVKSIDGFGNSQVRQSTRTQ